MLIEAEVENSYHFALGARCDGAEVMAACARYAQAAGGVRELWRAAPPVATDQLRPGVRRWRGRG